MLRNAFVQTYADRKPTVIVGPNDSALNQWVDTLKTAGISSGQIFYFKSKYPDEQVFSGDTFVLLTKNKLMSETRSFFFARE